MPRAWFFLTVAYVIGFAIPVLFAAVYGLISKGRLPDFTSSRDFSVAFGIYLFSYIFSLFVMWALSALSQEKEFFYRIWSRLSFFKRALLSHGITILIWVILEFVQNTIESFSDLFFSWAVSLFLLRPLF